ncbi:hypothetical protein JA1_002767 [Spathaspora sp. JA1]|nr:hypothetical protein JA1_002767 [Spathaspora sp. JA1]
MNVRPARKVANHIRIAVLGSVFLFLAKQKSFKITTAIMRFAIINALFLTGTIAVTITSTTTLTTHVPNDPILVQPGGVATFLNILQFLVSSLTIKSLGQFFFSTNVVSTVEIQTLENSGYALFDISQVSQVNSVYLQFRTDNQNQNTGEFVVYGNYLNVDIYDLVNAGTMTFWGTSGLVLINEAYNFAHMCFHHVVGWLQGQGGIGCFAIDQTNVYVNGAKAGFEPTVSFIGLYNGFEIQLGTTRPSIFVLNNFGVGNYVAVPSVGYAGQWNYDSTLGIATVYFQDTPVKFNIGTGYDQTKFTLTVQNQMLYFRYPDPVPIGANQGGCRCALNLNPPPPPVLTTEEPTTEVEITTTYIETSTNPEETTPEETTPQEATTSPEETTPVEPTTTQEDSTSSTVTPEPSDCKHMRRNGNHDCHGEGPGGGPGHGNDHDNDGGHGNDHDDGHGNDHGNGGGNGPGQGNDHDDGHNNGNNSGHGDDHGNDNNGPGKGGNGNDHGSGDPPKGNDGHGNNNNNGNGNNNNNQGNSNGKGNDRDNNQGNGKGNDKGNEKGNSNGKDNGKGKGHKRQDILDNSSSTNHVINSMLIIVLLVWLLIV